MSHDPHRDERSDDHGKAPHHAPHTHQPHAPQELKPASDPPSPGESPASSPDAPADGSAPSEPTVAPAPMPTEPPSSPAADAMLADEMSTLSLASIDDAQTEPAPSLVEAPPSGPQIETESNDAELAAPAETSVADAPSADTGSDAASLPVDSAAEVSPPSESTTTVNDSQPPATEAVATSPSNSVSAPAVTDPPPAADASRGAVDAESDNRSVPAAHGDGLPAQATSPADAVSAQLAGDAAPSMSRPVVLVSMAESRKSIADGWDALAGRIEKLARQIARAEIDAATYARNQQVRACLRR
jgi:hypothetical protein